MTAGGRRKRARGTRKTPAASETRKSFARRETSTAGTASPWTATPYAATHQPIQPLEPVAQHTSHFFPSGQLQPLGFLQPPADAALLAKQLAEAQQALEREAESNKAGTADERCWSRSAASTWTSCSAQQTSSRPTARSTSRPRQTSKTDCRASRASHRSCKRSCSRAKKRTAACTTSWSCCRACCGASRATRASPRSPCTRKTTPSTTSRAS